MTRTCETEFIFYHSNTYIVWKRDLKKQNYLLCLFNLWSFFNLLFFLPSLFLIFLGFVTLKPGPALASTTWVEQANQCQKVNFFFLKMDPFLKHSMQFTLQATFINSCTSHYYSTRFSAKTWRVVKRSNTDMIPVLLGTMRQLLPPLHQ